MICLFKALYDTSFAYVTTHDSTVINDCYYMNQELDEINAAAETAPNKSRPVPYLEKLDAAENTKAKGRAKGTVQGKRMKKSKDSRAEIYEPASKK